MSGSTPIPGPITKTRVIHLDAGQQRDRSLNVGTMIQIGLPAAPRFPFETLFATHYRSIRAAALSNEAPGLAIIAVHAPSRRLAARVWLAARADSLAAAIVGRHSEVDVLLDDPKIALRHIAILLPRARSWDAHALAYEILDLRTGVAFADERGRQLEAAWCDGPAFVSCGAYAIFVLQTGDPTDWPASADDAWSMLPARVMAGERPAEPDRWRRGAHRAAVPSRTQSFVTQVPGLIAPEARLLADDETPRGHLSVRTAHGARSLAVGDRALARGILLGRYARCDGAELFADHQLSRAHLLVKRVDDRVLAIDTASTEGIVREGDARRTRVVDLEHDGVILGASRGVVRWR